MRRYGIVDSRYNGSFIVTYGNRQIAIDKAREYAEYTAPCRVIDRWDTSIYHSEGIVIWDSRKDN